MGRRPHLHSWPILAQTEHGFRYAKSHLLLRLRHVSHAVRCCRRRRSVRSIGVDAVR